MQSFEIIERIRHGEDSITQFKQDISDANRLAEELVAFSIPTQSGFNAQTKLEIDETVLGELLVNALVHRDYY